MLEDDADFVSRWLALLGLLSHADELLLKGEGPPSALALIAADTSCEIVLAQIADSSETPPSGRPVWDEVFSAAISAIRAQGRRIPEGLPARVRTAHQLRNRAVHQGQEPTKRQAERAVETARELMAFAVEGSPLAGFSGADPVDAVATLVSISAVSEPLARAAAALREGRTEDAANEGADALDAALNRTWPRLGSPPRTDVARRLRRISAMGVSADPTEELAGKTALLHAWVLALGTGLRPSRLAAMQRVLGLPVRSGAKIIEVRRGRDVQLTPSVVETTIRETADVIFRLWISDGIRPFDRETESTSGDG